jgi:HK97 family phage prohead protease
MGIFNQCLAPTFRPIAGAAPRLAKALRKTSPALAMPLSQQLAEEKYQSRQQQPLTRDGERYTLLGFIPNNVYRLPDGNFERFADNAFSFSVRHDSISLLCEHILDEFAGDNVNFNNLQLWADADGLHLKAFLYWANPIHIQIVEGILSGKYVGLSVGVSSCDTRNVNGVLLRSNARLSEVSLATCPTNSASAVCIVEGPAWRLQQRAAINDMSPSALVSMNAARILLKERNKIAL